jgi:hypothetical protein
MRHSLCHVMETYPAARWSALPLILLWTALWGHIVWKLLPIRRWFPTIPGGDVELDRAPVGIYGIWGEVTI